MLRNKGLIWKCNFLILKYWHYAIMFGTAALILIPMIILQGEYIYTIHDCLDQTPAMFEVLRRSGLFYSIDSPLPILGGMSTCYLYYDYGIYRLFHFLFGFIWAEILLKAAAMTTGYFCMNHLLRYLFKDYVLQNDKIFSLLAWAYAITPYTSLRALAFAVLPFLLEKLIEYYQSPQNAFAKKDSILILFGFLVPFSSVGMFVLILWCIVYLLNLFANKTVNARMLICIALMILSVCIFNINILVYIFRGDEINRSLMEAAVFSGWMAELKALFLSAKDVFKNGQYHAGPVLGVLYPVCLMGCATAFIEYINKRINRRLFKIIFFTISAMAFLSLFYAVADRGWILRLMEQIIPFLKGFGFQRMVVINNALWYVLAAALVAALIKNDSGRIMCYVVLLAQLYTIIHTSGYYQNTWENLRHEYSIESGKVTFNEYYDVDYFDELKDKMHYNNEPVISVGYHPAVAMYNGFNNLDGYVTVHSMEYHNAFRKIIEPQLEEYPELKEYYDTWGGRMYVFADSSKNVAPTRNKTVHEKELLIDPDAFKAMGGKYILSRYILSNAEQLGVSLTIDYDKMDSIYHIFVYEIE